MSRPDRKWRPSDADRERYAGAVSQAFAEGRIDATDMESRTALIYEATTIAELDTLVEDMPAPAPAPAPVAPAPSGPGVGSWIRMAFGLVVLALLVGFLVTTFRDDEPTTAGASGDDLSVIDPPPPPDAPPAPDAPPPAPDLDELPDIDTEKLDLFTEEGLAEMWLAFPDAGHTDLDRLTLFPDRATVYASAGTTRPGLVEVEYEGGLVLPPEPYGGSISADAPFFTWTDVPWAAVQAAIDAMPGITGAPDVTVSHISIDEDADDGVTINVYPDGDTGVGYVKFDATGTQVIRVY